MTAAPAGADTWEVQIARYGGAYVSHAVSNRFVDAWRDYDTLDVRGGLRKRLLRNGVVIDRHVSQRNVEQVTAELFPVSHLTLA